MPGTVKWNPNHLIKINNIQKKGDIITPQFTITDHPNKLQVYLLESGRTNLTGVNLISFSYPNCQNKDGIILPTKIPGYENGKKYRIMIINSSLFQSTQSQFMITSSFYLEEEGVIIDNSENDKFEDYRIIKAIFPQEISFDNTYFEISISNLQTTHVEFDCENSNSEQVSLNSIKDEYLNEFLPKFNQLSKDNAILKKVVSKMQDQTKFFIEKHEHSKVVIPKMEKEIETLKLNNESLIKENKDLGKKIKRIKLENMRTKEENSGLAEYIKTHIETQKKEDNNRKKHTNK